MPLPEPLSLRLRSRATLTGALLLAASVSLPAGAAPLLLTPGAPRLLLQSPGAAGRRKSEKPALAPRKVDDAAKASDAKPQGDDKSGEANAPPAANGGLASWLVSTIREYAIWILVGLGALLAGVLAWAVLGRKNGVGAGEDAFAELGLAQPSRAAAEKAEHKSRAGRKFSSTRIRASEVKSKVQGRVTSSEVETDREYALVVDEDALKKPPLPEGSEAPRLTDSQIGRLPRPADTSRIQRHLESQDYEGAFEEYERQLSSSATVVVDAKMEQSLGSHFLKAQDLDKALKILEHHVTTAAPAEIEAEVFFNLGYIHFMRKAFGRSRKYLRRFVETETNPAYVERARRILNQIEAPPSRN